MISSPKKGQSFHGGILNNIQNGSDTYIYKFFPTGEFLILLYNFKMMTTYTCDKWRETKYLRRNLYSSLNKWILVCKYSSWIDWRGKTANTMLGWELLDYQHSRVRSHNWRASLAQSFIWKCTKQPYTRENWYLPEGIAIKNTGHNWCSLDFRPSWRKYWMVSVIDAPNGWDESHAQIGQDQITLCRDIQTESQLY